ncbi:TPA: hypothetical protein QC311_002251 [Bacillus cereus]|nr:hypothetical protein [Bacillus cereus]HDR8461412.1 hypothetical protein [Bacillus cereus]
MANLEELYPRSYDATRLETETDTYESLLQNLKTGIENGSYKSSVDTIFQNVADKKIDYVTFVNSTMRLAPMSTPDTGLFSPLVGLFFSGLNQISTTTRDTQGNVFQAMNPIIENALGRPLTQAELDKLNSQVVSLRNALSPYQTTMNNIINKLGGFANATPELLDEFYGDINSVLTTLAGSLPSFLSSDPDQSLIGLPYFSAFANMHLSLYKDILVHGSTWNPTHYNAQVIDDVKDKIKQFSITYAQQVYDYFKAGLDNLGGSNLKPSDTKLFSRQKYYIQTLTINALNIARLFPTFNPDIYPLGVTTNLPTSHQFVSPIIPGYCMPPSFPSGFDFPIYGSGVIRKDGELNFIKGTSATSQTYGSPVFLQLVDQNGKVRSWGKDDGEQYVLDSINTFDPLIGFGAAAAVKFDTSGHPQYQICDSDSDSKSYPIFGFQFLTDSAKLTTWSRIDLPADFMPILRAPRNYKIRNIYPLYDSSKTVPFQGYVCVFTPINPTSSVLAPDSLGTMSIIGIPFESFGYQQGWVVPEWTTGSNVVKLPPNQTITVPIFNILEGPFTMRVNYACSTDVPVSINLKSSTNDLIFQTETAITFSATNSTNDFPGKNGYYRNKKITDTLDMSTFSMDTDYLHLTNTGTSDIFLDRVEFIPAASNTAQAGTFIGPEFTLPKSILPMTIFSGDTVYNTIEIEKSVDNIELQLYLKGVPVDSPITPTANTPITKQVPTGFDQITIRSTILRSGTNVVNVIAKLTFDSSIPVETPPSPGWSLIAQESPIPTALFSNPMPLGEGDPWGWEIRSSDFKNAVKIWEAPNGKAGKLSTVFKATTSDATVTKVALFYKLDDTLEGWMWTLDGEEDGVYNIGPGGDQYITSLYAVAFSEQPGASVMFTLLGHINLVDKSLTEQKDLEQITTQVNKLFASNSNDSLATTVNDYWIDQVVKKVDALSDETFGKEKKALRKLVNQAKQLSKKRNLLTGGSFDTLDAWKLGKHVIRREDGDLFKGEHLLLPPSTTLSPSYAYQKIDESKLKPYTRYTVSGFVAQGDPLEVVVSRYGKEVEKTLHVPYEEAHPITSEPTPNCCKPGMPSSCNGETPDSHVFQYSIDVGALQTETNLGISLGLRIGKTKENTLGLARIGNLEIREDRPLTASEKRKVQKVEKKWKKQWEKERTETAAKLQPVLNQINALYVNNDWNGALRPHVTEADIHAITLPDLPKQRHWFMGDREGEHHSITQKMQQALTRAKNLLEGHNLIHNGNFTNGVDSWTVSGHAAIHMLDGGNQALFLPHWDSSATQKIQITNFDEDTAYTLRVIGKGKGKITIQHGTAGEHVETMTFSQKTMQKQELPNILFETAEIEIDITSEDGGLTIDSIELIEMPDMEM